MNALSAKTASTIRRLSWVDVALTAPLAIPGLSHLYLQLIGWLDAALGFHSAVTSTNAIGMLLMNTTGTMAICWCIARIRAPSLLLGWLDVYARIVIAALVLGYVTNAGVSLIFLAFFLSETVGAIIEFRVLKSERKSAA